MAQAEDLDGGRVTFADITTMACVEGGLERSWELIRAELVQAVLQADAEGLPYAWSEGVQHPGGDQDLGFGATPAGRFPS